MRRSFILLCVISRVSLEMQSVQRFYMAREKTPESQPIQTGYVYKQVNYQPPMILSFGNKRGREGQFGYKETKVAGATPLKKSTTSGTHNISEQTSKKPVSADSVKSIEKQVLRNPKREAIFEDQELVKEESHTILNYDKHNEFLSDEEDVRTDSRNSYDGWPFFYHSPYEYEPMKFYSEVEKAHDKRFMLAEDKRVIPVHEYIKDDIVDNRIYTEDDTYNKRTLTTDNPILGDEAFFSYVLNDYFDKTDDYEPFISKGLNWGKEFDQEISFPDLEDYARSIRRLNEDLPSHKKVYGTDKEVDRRNLKKTKADSYDNKQKSEENVQGHERNQNRQSYRNYNGENDRGFKEFADYFANRFGSENQNNISKHMGKKNIDKGEKKKGFRNVYHKDEYQEETEFHDHNTEKVDLEIKGDSEIRLGGLEDLLHSQAAAAAGNNKTSKGENENYERKKYDKSNQSERRRHNDNNFKQYRDVAKNAAMSNNADYIDKYMI